MAKKKKKKKKKSFKYLIGYNDDVIRPLCIKFTQMIGYVKCLKCNKTMPFKISDKKLFKKIHPDMEKS